MGIFHSQGKQVTDSIQAKPFSAKKGFASLIVLLALFTWAFYPEIIRIITRSKLILNNVHIFLVPFAIAMFILVKKNTLRQCDTHGSAAGFLLIFLGCFCYAVAAWPFSFGYARDLAMVPVLAGILLLCFGRKVFFKLIPVFLFVFLAIPIGPRLTATLVIRPETYTLMASQNIMELLPNVTTELSGLDLTIYRSGTSNIVALGRTSRAFQLYFVYALIALFVFFTSNRTICKYIAAVIMTVPVIFLCNLARFLMLSAFTAYFNTSALSPISGTIAALLSICLAYLMFILIFNLKINLFIEDEPLCETGE